MDEPTRVRTLAVAAVTASLAVAAPAAAQDPVLPLEVRGVRAENAASGGVTITFTSRAAKLYRRIAGLRTIVRCQALSEGALLVPLDRTTELFEDTSAPRVRRPLRIRHAAGARFDVCELTALRSRGRGARRTFRTVLSLAVPITQPGAVYLDARRVGERLVAMMVFTASLGSGGRYPAAQAVAADVPRLVPLAAPGDSPPPGRYGLYSDAAQHLTVVGLTATGTRLFIDADGGMLTSNVPELVLTRR
jgi:hypothetical protein